MDQLNWRRVSYFPSVFNTQGITSFLVVGFAAIGGGFSLVASATTLLGLLGLTSIQYFIVRWVVLDDQVIIRRGIFAFTDTVLPFREVHDVDFVQNPIQKLFGVGVVTFQMSNADTELASIPNLSLHLIEEIRSIYREYLETTDDQKVQSSSAEILSSLDSELQTKEDAHKILANLGVVENALLSIIRPPLAWFFGFVAIALGVLAQTNLIQEQLIDRLKVYFDEAQIQVAFQSQFPFLQFESASLPDLALLIGLGVLSLFVVSVLTWLFAGVASFLVHHNFSLTFDNQILRVTSGATMRADRKTPQHRIQMIRVVENLRHRVLGYKSIYYDSSSPEGGYSQSLFEGSFGKWLIPLIRDDRVENARTEIFPDINFQTSEWQTVEMRAWKRRFKRNLIYLVPVAILMFIVTLWFVVLIVPVLIWEWYVSKKYVGSVAYALDRDGLLLRKGWWVATESLVLYEKIQGVSVRQTLFDRQNQMKSVCVDIAAHDSKRYAIEIPYLHQNVASRLADRLLIEAQARRFEW